MAAAICGGRILSEWIMHGAGVISYMIDHAITSGIVFLVDHDCPEICSYDNYIKEE